MLCKVINTRIAVFIPEVRTSNSNTIFLYEYYYDIDSYYLSIPRNVSIEIRHFSVHRIPAGFENKEGIISGYHILVERTSICSPTGSQSKLMYMHNADCGRRFQLSCFCNKLHIMVTCPFILLG